MNKSPLYFPAFATLIYLAAGCTGNTPATVITPPADSLAHTPAVKVAPTPPRAPFVQDPFIDINRFDTATGNHFIDSIYNEYYLEATVTGEHDLCLGDACTSYKKLVNPNAHTTLYMVKTDCSEYGFCNRQFLLKNDSLYFTRNFTVNMERDNTPNTTILWRIEEIVHWFNGNSITCYKKTAFSETREGFDFTLKTLAPVLTPAEAGAYAKEMESLNETLTLKERAEAN